MVVQVDRILANAAALTRNLQRARDPLAVSAQECLERRAAVLEVRMRCGEPLASELSGQQLAENGGSPGKRIQGFLHTERVRLAAER